MRSDFFNSLISGLSQSDTEGSGIVREHEEPYKTGHAVSRGGSSCHPRLGGRMTRRRCPQAERRGFGHVGLLSFGQQAAAT